MKTRPRLKIGDRVIFRAAKHSSHPGPRAKGIEPETHGEQYVYEVDKFWVIDEVQAAGDVVVRTRRGKRHILSPSNPRLRAARWWERWLYAGRFPRTENDSAEKPTPENVAP